VGSIFPIWQEIGTRRQWKLWSCRWQTINIVELLVYHCTTPKFSSLTDLFGRIAIFFTEPLCAKFRTMSPRQGGENVTIKLWWKMDTHHVSFRQSVLRKVRGKGWEGVSGGDNEENETVGWRTEWRSQEDGDPHDWSLGYNQTYRPLKISQTDITQETKLIRLLRDFSARVKVSPMGMSEDQVDKVVIQSHRSAHIDKFEDDGLWTISIQTPIMIWVSP